MEFFNRTKQLDIELIEQPLPAKAISEMKALPDEIKIKIAADESLITPKNALELVKPPKASGIFNIKLMKCGGIDQALKIADIAQQENVDLFWGCNDESIVSITAALHAAFAGDRRSLACWPVRYNRLGPAPGASARPPVACTPRNEKKPRQAGVSWD